MLNQKTLFIAIFDTKLPLTLMLTSRSLVVGLMFYSAISFGQGKYKIDKASINFTSNAQLELIKASTNSVQGLLDPATQQFAFTVDIKTFQGFNSQLQREHFNEKYLESEKFPRAKFSGKVIEAIDFTADGVHEIRAKGDLEIHGVKQTRIIRGKLIVKQGVIEIESKFTVPLADHNITIPNIVSQKIATEIEVDFRATMKSQ